MNWTVVGGFVLVAVGLSACASLLAAGLWRMTHPKGEGDETDQAVGEWSAYAEAAAPSDRVLRHASSAPARVADVRPFRRDQITARTRMKNILQ